MFSVKNNTSRWHSKNRNIHTIHNWNHLNSVEWFNDTQTNALAPQPQCIPNGGKLELFCDLCTRLLKCKWPLGVKFQFFFLRLIYFTSKKKKKQWQSNINEFVSCWAKFTHFILRFFWEKYTIT